MGLFKSCLRSCFALACCVSRRWCIGQELPNKPMKFIVRFVGGGPTTSPRGHLSQLRLSTKPVIDRRELFRGRRQHWHASCAELAPRR